MMKKYLFRAAMLVLALVIVLTLAACGEDGKTETIETIAIADWQSYTIMRPDAADKTEVDAAIKFSQAVESTYGTRLKLSTDWVKRGEEPPAGTKEILIGRTNRPESDIDLKYHDFVIEFVNDRIVITGGSGEAVDKAVDWFIVNCFGETLEAPAARYSVAGEYPMENVTINGVKLSDYSLPASLVPEEQALYKTLAVWIAENSGYYPASKGDHVIRIGTNAELSMDEISLKTKNSDLMLEVSGDGYGFDCVIEQFYDRLENREGDAITMNETVKIPLGNFSVATADQLAGWQAQADALREEILNTPNMEIPKDAKVYYISENGKDSNNGLSPETAWKSIDRLKSVNIPAGSYVCFERGGVYRGKFTAREGVTYTAYGKGDKPKIYGSPFNGAEHGTWEEVADNIWRYSEKFVDDVGTLVMDGGKEHAIKITLDYSQMPVIEYVSKEEWKGYINLNEELEFWHDLNGTNVTYGSGGYIYLYCSRGNPAEVFKQIEFNTRTHIITASKVNDITFDNLCIMYGGAHGIGTGTNKNVTITNCEVGWIGGSLQHYKDGKPTRYGNGLQVYVSVDGYTIDHCWVYECYDAAVTHQYASGNRDDCIEKNVFYTNNLLERNVYNIEYFMGKGEIGTEIRYQENIVIKNNIMLDAGYGWGRQRPDKTSPAHIKGWDHMNQLEGDFIIEDNIMLRSTHMTVHIAAYDASDLPTSFKNNVIGQVEGGDWGRYSKTPTTLLPFTYRNVSDERLADNQFYLIETDEKTEK